MFPESPEKDITAHMGIYKRDRTGSGQKQTAVLPRFAFAGAVLPMARKPDKQIFTYIIINKRGENPPFFANKM